MPQDRSRAVVGYVRSDVDPGSLRCFLMPGAPHLELAGPTRQQPRLNEILGALSLEQASPRLARALAVC